MVSTAIKIAVSLVWVYCCFAVIAPRILHEAYDIRLEAIKEYGECTKSKLIPSRQVERQKLEKKSSF
jgi:hypothetical protein